LRPLAKSGLDLAIEGLDLGLGAGGANPSAVGCILTAPGLWRSARPSPCAVHRSRPGSPWTSWGRSLRRSGA